MAGHRVLIISQPGPLRHGLRALLSSMPNVETVTVAAQAKAALQSISRSQPAMVLLDSSLPGEGFLPLLKQIKVRWPQLECLVLADGTEQQRQAQAARADRVLLKGVSAARLSAAMERLLAQAGQVEREATADGVTTDTAAKQQLPDDVRKGQADEA
jgi:DNA-binding NarL/FixJ family response regulator